MPELSTQAARHDRRLFLACHHFLSGDVDARLVSPPPSPQVALENGSYERARLDIDACRPATMPTLLLDGVEQILRQT